MSLGYADLPRQTSADYLTGCTDPNERKLAPGLTEADVPATPEALEAAFKKSEIHARMLAERDAFQAASNDDEKARNDFREAVAADKRRGVSKKSKYTASFPAQVQALVVRQFQLKAQDKVDLVVSWVTSIVVAIISGAVYLNMPQTAAGAFTRGGAIFIALLFNSCVPFSLFTALLRQADSISLSLQVPGLQRAPDADARPRHRSPAQAVRLLPPCRYDHRHDARRRAEQHGPDPHLLDHHLLHGRLGENRRRVLLGAFHLLLQRFPFSFLLLPPSPSLSTSAPALFEDAS